MNFPCVRPRAVSGFLIVITFLVSLAGCGGSDNNDSSSTVVMGETQTVSGSKVSAWARIDSTNTVLEVGSTVPFALIQNPPAQEGAGPAGAIATVAFPAQAQSTTYFNHFELQWEPNGHPPDFTMVPHFDLHFYSIAPQEVLQVMPPDPMVPAADHIPPGFVYPGVDAVIPEMGAHAHNPDEYQGVFTKVFIAGFYDGHMTFLEPAMNETFLLQKPSYSVAVPRPAVLDRTTRYPATFTTTYNSATDSYAFVFSNFTAIQ